MALQSLFLCFFFFLSVFFFFFSSRRRHTRCSRDWSSDVCSSDLLTNRTMWDTARRIKNAVIEFHNMSKYMKGAKQSADINAYKSL